MSHTLWRKTNTEVMMNLMTYIMPTLTQKMNQLQFQNLRLQAKFFQFFLTSLEGDFTWPIASFPVYSVTAEKLNKHMIWPLIKALDIVSNSNIKVVFEVCDGGPRNSNFFNTSSKKSHG